MKTASLLVLLNLPALAQEPTPWWERWFGEDSSIIEQIQDAERLLIDAKLATDSKALLEMLRELTPTADNERRIGALFKQLDAEKFQDREKASATLIALGPKAIEHKVEWTKVAVDFPQPGPHWRARRAIRRFIDLLILGPEEATVANIRRLTDVSFYHSGWKTVQSRKELEERFRYDVQLPLGIQIKSMTLRVETVCDYLLTANNKEKVFFYKMPIAMVLAVHTNMEVFFKGIDRTVTMTVFVRLSATGDRVIGMVEPNPPLR